MRYREYGFVSINKLLIGGNMSSLFMCLFQLSGVFRCATYLQPEGECEVIDEDLTKPYPDCCPTMKCKEKEKEEASEAPVTEGVAGE